MNELIFHRRPNGSSPYDDYVTYVHDSGRKKDSAKIRAVVIRLGELGSRELTAMGKAEKMNDVWQLRVDQHRIFYFWHDEAMRYVLLNGFLKKTRKTPQAELKRAETLRWEHLATQEGGMR